MFDNHVSHFLADQARRTAAEFDKTLVGPLPVLEWGHVAEYREATEDFPARIFISGDELHPRRIRYQIAHEVFHWLCSPPRTFHWTHELLAVETAVRAMEETRELDYAQREMKWLTADAELLALEEMLRTPLGHGYLDGLYGRAWVSGRQLIDAVGWEKVKLLAAASVEAGTSRVAAWLLMLPVESRQGAEAILGAPSAEWV